MLRPLIAAWACSLLAVIACQSSPPAAPVPAAPPAPVPAPAPAPAPPVGGEPERQPSSPGSPAPSSGNPSACARDEDCPGGQVCGRCGDAPGTCMPGCHKDSQCPSGKCQEVQCFRCPCPGQCIGAGG